MVGGSIGAVALLVLASMPSVISSSATKEKISYFSQGKIQLNKYLEKIEQCWIPGSLIGLLFIFYLIFAAACQIIGTLLLDWIRGA